MRTGIILALLAGLILLAAGCPDSEDAASQPAPGAAEGGAETTEGAGDGY
jgi:hypothetical protein